MFYHLKSKFDAVPSILEKVNWVSECMNNISTNFYEFNWYVCEAKNARVLTTLSLLVLAMFRSTCGGG